MARYVALGLLLVGGLAFAADSGGMVTSFSGRGVYESGSPVTVGELAKGVALGQGDKVTIATGSTLSLEFEDGSVMDVTGPAQFELELLADYARTIRLLAGTINRFEAGEITTGIVTPGGAFVAVQDGSVFARAEPNEAGTRVRSTFKLFDGTGVKVGIQGGDARMLAADKPAVFDLAVAGPEPVTPTTVAAPAPAMVGSDKFILSGHVIEFYPAGGFRVEGTDGGGQKLTSTVPEGSWGVVTVDGETSFYLASGESVSFSAAGATEGHNGVVHVYPLLDHHSLFFDVVRDPADSSYAGNLAK